MTTVNQTVSGGQTNGDILPSASGQNLGSLTQLWNAFIQICSFGGASSGATQLQASAVASGVLTLPAKTDTLVGRTDFTLTLKKGTGSGNYTSASTTYVRVDSTNLAYTVTVPTGWKLSVQASGVVGTNTAAVSCFVALADGSADNTGILVEELLLGAAPTPVSAFSLGWILTGDGASHTFNLQYKTSNGADVAAMLNSSATLIPTMTFILSPSN